MKGHSQLLGGLVVMGSLLMVHNNRGAEESFSFDTLYPKNACMKATEQCVKVWGAFDDLLHQKEPNPTHIIQIMERSLGQLLLAQQLLANISRDGKKPSPEQMHYLSRVIGTIADRYEQLPRIDADQTACVHACIAQIKQLVENHLAE